MSEIGLFFLDLKCMLEPQVMLLFYFLVFGIDMAQKLI